jgi:hypothetical protein
MQKIECCDHQSSRSSARLETITTHADLDTPRCLAASSIRLSISGGNLITVGVRFSASSAPRPLGAASFLLPVDFFCPTIQLAPLMLI